MGKISQEMDKATCNKECYRHEPYLDPSVAKRKMEEDLYIALPHINTSVDDPLKNHKYSRP